MPGNPPHHIYDDHHNDHHIYNYDDAHNYDDNYNYDDHRSFTELTPAIDTMLFDNETVRSFLSMKFFEIS